MEKETRAVREVNDNGQLKGNQYVFDCQISDADSQLQSRWKGAADLVLFITQAFKEHSTMEWPQSGSGGAKDSFI